MIVKYYKRNVYGQDLFYLVDKDISRTWNRLTRLKSINDEGMSLLTNLFMEVTHIKVTFEEVVEPKNNN